MRLARYLPDWLIQVVNWATVRPSVGYLWCRFYRACFEADTSGVTMPRYDSLTQLSEVLARCVWVADGPKQLWDVMYSPKRVQLTIDRATNGRPEIGDCDEFTAYAGDRIDDMIARSPTHEHRDPSGLAISATYVIQMTYRKKTGEVIGHHACAVRYRSGDGPWLWGHIGNGHKRLFRGGFLDPRWIPGDFHGEGGKTLHWVVVSLDLTKVWRRGFGGGDQ